MRIEGNKRNACLAVLKMDVHVRESDDAILPCSFLWVQDISKKVFDWKKAKRMEVFLCSNGPLYNDGRFGQDPQFTERVTHFPDELKNGNASIKIRNTTIADSGNYTSVFPHDNLQFTIRLLVGERLIEGAYRPSELVPVHCSGGFLSPNKHQDSQHEGRSNISLTKTIKNAGDLHCRLMLEEIGHERSTHGNFLPLGLCKQSTSMYFMTNSISLYNAKLASHAHFWGGFDHTYTIHIYIYTDVLKDWIAHMSTARSRATASEKVTRVTSTLFSLEHLCT